MSLPPKEKDLVGILNDYERKIDELEFLVSTQDFDTGAGIIGPQGPQGLTGPAGPAGQTGSQGPAGTIAIGTVTTAPSGSSAAVTNIGTTSAAILDFDIPRGEKGNAATISVGTVTTTASGTTASVVNSGTSGEAVFDFEIPRGDKGDTGEAGADGNVTLYGAGPPSNSLGVDDDFYIDTSAGMVYGPKAGGSWPASGPIQTPGPQGPQGPTGASSSRLFFLY